jgi:hypothetical protein
MAKAKRIPISFQPATHAALERLASAAGVSISGLVSGFMDEAAPSFDGIVEALNVAKSKPIQALDLLQDELLKTQQKAFQGQLELSEARKQHNKRRPKK